MRSRWFEPDDVAFVMSSWLKSAKRGPTTRRMGQSSYFVFQRGHIEKLLAREGVRVRMATDDDGTLLGWLCWSVAGVLPVVHYAYVKQAHRHTGVLRGLAAEAGITAESELLYTATSPAAKYVAAHVAHAEPLDLEEFLS